MTSLVTQADGKESACMQETWIQSLGWEDPLEEGMAPHSSILAWRIPWTEKPGELQSMGSQSDTTERLTLSFHFTFMAAKRVHNSVHGAGKVCLASLPRLDLEYDSSCQVSGPYILSESASPAALSSSLELVR